MEAEAASGICAGGGVNAVKESDRAVSKQIRVLENRLDKALVKFNEALAFNKQVGGTTQRGLPSDFLAHANPKSVRMIVGTILCPFRVAYRRVSWIFSFGIFTKSVGSPLNGESDKAVAGLTLSIELEASEWIRIWQAWMRERS